MLMNHLLCGLIVGVLAAAGGFAMGLPAWGAASFHILGGSLGIGLSAGVLILRLTSLGPDWRMDASLEP